MIQRASISVLGMYSWDDSLFDGFVIPQALDKETVVDNLLLELAELELIYWDFNYMKFAIKVWSKKELPVWEKLYETTMYEYNPIKNFDKEEHYSEKNKTSDTKESLETRDLSTVSNDTHTRNLSDSELVDKTYTDNTTTDRTSKVENTKDSTSKTTHDSDTSGKSATNNEDLSQKSVSAWNQETTYTPNERIVQEGETNNETTGHVEYETDVKDSVEDVTDTTGKDKVVGTQTDKGSINKNYSGTESNVGSNTNTGTVRNAGTEGSTSEREYTVTTIGNIGTTTTQQLIKEQREVVELNVMTRIIQDFKKRFCLLVY